MGTGLKFFAVLPFFLALNALAADLPEVVNARGRVGVIFPAAQKAFQSKIGRVVEYWTPKPRDVARAEKLARRHLAQAAPGLYGKLDGYKRQYAGYLANGYRVIYINFFCSPVEGWTRQEMAAEGGGECFFSMRVDLDNRKCFDLRVNGPQ